MAKDTIPQMKTGNGHYPTMSEIARQCGVSQSTVSRALHNVKGRQSDETRQRIIAVARKMGYDPMQFQAARKLAEIRHGCQSLNYIIGFYFYHLGFAETNYLSRVQQGILSSISRTDFELLTSDSTPKGPNGDYILSPPYRRGEVDGVLIVEQDSRWQPVYDLLRQHPNFGSRPMVGLVTHLEGCSSVYPDNISAGYQALLHLLRLGHRHILCQQELAVEGTGVETQRTRGYKRACEEAGLSFDSVLSQLLWVSPDASSHAAELVTYLKQHPEITALIAGNDQNAAVVHRVLVNAGFRVPEDISVISYDDTDAVTDGRGNNILTTIRLPLIEVGKQGAELLIRRIMGQEDKDRDIILPAELVVRGSTTPLAR